MPFILPANTLSAGGYDVDNSLRFDDGNPDSLNKTIGTSTDTKIWTCSFWWKAGQGGSQQQIFSVTNGGADNTFFQIQYRDNVEIRLNGYNTTWLTTNRKFRDYSAWYHVVVSADSTQGTAANRLKLYINGIEETSFATDNRSSISLNQTWGVNLSSQPHYIGAEGGTGSGVSGYLSEFNFIDGQALTPTDFGEFDADSGVWKPIAYTGTYGTNGFFLEFQDSGALGDDVSGNGNDFTVNNLTSIDQTTDTPTNNHATFNPLGNYFPATVFSEGNLKGTFNSSNYSFNNSTIGVSAGRWYFETKIITTATDNQSLIGISDRDSVGTTDELGSGAYQYGFYGGTQGTPNPQGKIRTNDGYSDYSDVTYTDDDIIGTYVDLEDNKIYFSKNGTLLNSGTGFSITAPASTDTGFYFLSVGSYSGSNSPVYEVNFGSPSFALADTAIADDNGYGAFEYSPNITGDGTAKKFYALNTKNLAEFG